MKDGRSAADPGMHAIRKQPRAGALRTIRSMKPILDNSPPEDLWRMLVVWISQR